MEKLVSPDDAWSLLGYVALIALTRVSNPAFPIAQASALAAGMLALFWIGSKNVRARNAERSPNIRVASWAVVALVSVLYQTLAVK
jgi:hypothetical protein